MKRFIDKLIDPGFWWKLSFYTGIYGSIVCCIKCPKILWFKLLKRIFYKVRWKITCVYCGISDTSVKIASKLQWGTKGY